MNIPIYSLADDNLGCFQLFCSIPSGTVNFFFTFFSAHVCLPRRRSAVYVRLRFCCIFSDSTLKWGWVCSPATVHECRRDAKWEKAGMRRGMLRKPSISRKSEVYQPSKSNLLQKRKAVNLSSSFSFFKVKNEFFIELKQSFCVKYAENFA